MFDNFKEYFSWLCVTIGVNSNDSQYSKLLTDLFSMTFVSNFGMDEDRIGDVRRLRDIYCDGHGVSADEFLFKPASIFEVMVALALRGEVDIMSDPMAGDRTGIWFWAMIRSLGLMRYTNGRYRPGEVFDIVNRFLKHQYEPNGKGGLFTCNHAPEDMRNIDVWKQMCYWFNEKLEKEGYFK